MTGCPQIFFGSGTPIPPSKIAPFIFRRLFWNYRILLAQDATSKKGLRVHPPNASFCPEVRPEIRKRDSNRWGRSLLMFSAEKKQGNFASLQGGPPHKEKIPNAWPKGETCRTARPALAMPAPFPEKLLIGSEKVVVCMSYEHSTGMWKL